MSEQRKQYRDHAEEIAALLAGRDSGEGAESPDELVGAEDGCDEDDPDGEDGGEGGSYYSSEAMDAARRIGH